VAGGPARRSGFCPGIIDTPIYGEGAAAEEFKAKLAAPIVFPKRMGRPAEFAQLVRTLIENDYMNAEVIRFDGGVRFQPKLKRPRSPGADAVRGGDPPRPPTTRGGADRSTGHSPGPTRLISLKSLIRYASTYGMILHIICASLS
jgi:hypothetical protein